MANTEAPAERKLLDPSELGTKEYWDALYAREITNYTDDVEDEGTVWFDESGAEEAVVKLLDRLDEEGVVGRGDAVLDLGTGNGHMLFTLLEGDEDEDEGREDGEGERREGWRGRMVGVDYSQASVDLARRVAEGRGLGKEDEGARGVRFETWDLLTQNPGDWAVDGGFGVVLDKGTFDAISLMPQPECQAQHACEVYRRKVLPLVKDGGVLVVTSCNWTRGELVGWLVGDAVEGEGRFGVWAEAEYPTFSFGGQTGSSIVTLAFRKRSAGGR